MTYSNTSGLGVFNQYGPRDTGGSVGVEDHDGSLWSLAIDITGSMLNTAFVPPVVIPKGSLFQKAVLRVDEAFNLGGTTPTVIFGAAGSVATNGIVLTETEMETVGTKNPASTGTGTWSQTSTTGTTAAAKVAFTLGGTTPTADATVGKATLILTYRNLAK